MTREKETNIIMCCQSPLKMGLMTGRASRTHTWSDPRRGHLCARSLTSVRVCKINLPHTYTHMTQLTVKSHAAHTEHTLSLSKTPQILHLKSSCPNFETITCLF